MDKLLTVEEAAALLDVSPRSIYEMTSSRGRGRSQNPLPVLRLNKKCLRFRVEDLTAWLERIAKETT
ncbi:MAG: helix-turn-helix domain-containing protein [Candidatus Sulfotelmatobacter sp.]